MISCTRQTDRRKELRLSFPPIAASCYQRRTYVGEEGRPVFAGPTRTDEVESTSVDGGERGSEREFVRSIRSSSSRPSAFFVVVNEKKEGREI